MEIIRYRVYPDNSVVHEDDFYELDNAQPYFDEFAELKVPSSIVEHIEEIISIKDGKENKKLVKIWNDASNYLLALKNEGFAKEYGGVEKLKNLLQISVDRYED